jgi:eukaryotic-like serine/threonine-protein kinase
VSTPSDPVSEVEIDDISPEIQVPWSSGDAVGRYHLLAKIATGGMAEIWLARQAGPRGFEKVIVIKRIVDSLSADPEFVEMFLDEARIAAQLNHPNIVQIFDLGEHAGAYYIAMEYLPGENLATVARAALKAGITLPIPHAVKIIAQAVEGLGHAHGRVGVNGMKLNVVHRDVSPQNIIITYDGLVKLVDFGIAKAANRGSQTLGGQIKGKVAYMAPEQATGEVIDHRADLFSIAVVLYELVTRTRLFHREDQFQALTQVTSDEAVQPAHVRNPDVPEGLSAILSRALEKKPDDRYPDAAAFQAALEGWLSAQGPAPTNADIAEMMKKLFAPRISARTRLIETAMTGDLTPSSARLGLKADTDLSMPGRTGNRTAAHHRPPKAAVLIPSAIALVLAGILIARIVFRRDAPPAAPPIPAAVLAKVATLKIETEPPGAAVVVDKKPVGRSPVTLEKLELKAHDIEAVLDKHQVVRRSVTLKEPGEKATVVLVLPEEAHEPPKAPEPPRAAAAPAPADAPKADESDRPAAPPPVKRPPVTTGRLSLNTQPWTRVTWNGRVLGDTPLIDVALPPGVQTLKLTNEEKGVSTSIEVEIKTGQTVKKVIKLE